SMQVPEVVAFLENNLDLKNSDIDKILYNWSDEALIYLLLSLDDEEAWENVVRYLDIKDKVVVKITGHDLKALGIKQGPVYREILDKIYQLKLNGELNSKEDEIAIVKNWIKENNYAINS
ncbi:MAG: poly(A) polymerase, partial [Syntrophomonadaceae bacterium]|nr:poly(A) polymerase [Syntrophomonadaceae bacterium]